jgi:hypothetical protein
VLQTKTQSIRRSWEWNMPGGNCRGVRPEGRKFVARVAWRGGWAYLGLLPEVEACRVSAKAREMKLAGELDGCHTAADVRRVVLAAIKTSPRSHPAPRGGEGNFPVSVYDGERVVQLGPFSTREEAERQRAQALRRRDLGLPIVPLDSD